MFKQQDKHVSALDNRTGVHSHGFRRSPNRPRCSRLKNDKKPIEFAYGKKTTGLPAIGKIALRISQRKHGPNRIERRNPITQVNS